MFKPRLQRLKFLYTDHPVYFLTACTHQRRALLAHAAVHDSFKDFCSKASERGVLVGRYVLLPDHVHFFAAFSAQAPLLSAWMKSLKNALSGKLNLMAIPPPHWQKGFFDHVMRSEETYHEKWLYVQQNPVRAGLVEKASDWPFQGEICSLEVRPEG